MGLGSRVSVEGWRQTQEMSGTRGRGDSQDGSLALKGREK